MPRAFVVKLTTPAHHTTLPAFAQELLYLKKDIPAPGQFPAHDLGADTTGGKFSESTIKNMVEAVIHEKAGIPAPSLTHSRWAKTPANTNTADGLPGVSPPHFR